MGEKSHWAFLGLPFPPLWNTMSSCILLFTYSLQGNKIDDAGAQALAEGLQHCTNLQKLEWVICLDIEVKSVRRVHQEGGNFHYLSWAYVCTRTYMYTPQFCFHNQSIHVLGDLSHVTFRSWTNRHTIMFLFIYSLVDNSIGVAGAQALVRSLQHCTDLKEFV